MDGQTFVEADIWTVAQTDQGNVVLVRPKSSDLAVPIFIGQLETQSILLGMGRVDVPRPLTHDLLLSMIATFGAELRRIEICDLRDGTFFARLILKIAGQDDAIVDSRPSDAIGLAVRANCPVFIAESVVEEAGISVNLVTGMQAEGEAQGRIDEVSDTLPEPSLQGAPAGALMPVSAESEAGRLRAELDRAVAEENYERAATIRDRLRDLGG